MKPGDRFDRYRIDDVLGAGGMGLVFRAYDERLDRNVAIKVLLDEEAGPSSRERLIREARSAAKLSHPNVVGVFDVGEHEGSPYVAMELVEGRSLRALVGAAESPEVRIRLLLEVARALAAAHDAQLVHRDIKPENVIVQADGHVKVLDFGIARRTAVKADASAPTQASLASLTAEGVKLGTPMYMAPEQIRGGPVDGRADQFAWAVTGYELFVGRPPWAGDAMAVIAAVIAEDPPPPPAEAQMPTPFAGLLRRALSKRPEDRYSSMRQIVMELETMLESLGPTRVSSPLRHAGEERSVSSQSHFPPRSQPPIPVAASVPPLTLSRRYSTQEMTNIFDRALAVQRRRFGYDEISQAAREVGIDEVSLHMAMDELSNRGAVDRSERQREEATAKVKRLGAIYGVIAAFFFLLNLGTWRGTLWAQVPVVCIGLLFGLAIVRQLFPKPSKRSLLASRDPALEYDVHQLSRLLAARAPMRIVAPPASPQVRIAERPPSTLEQAEAEVDAFLGHDQHRK